MAGSVDAAGSNRRRAHSRCLRLIKPHVRDVDVHVPAGDLRHRREDNGLAAAGAACHDEVPLGHELEVLVDRGRVIPTWFSREPGSLRGAAAAKEESDVLHIQTMRRPGIQR